LLFIIDAITGITPVDKEFAKLLRPSGKPIILVANKCESSSSDSGYYEAFTLAVGEPVAISAEHSLGLGEIYEALNNCASRVSVELGQKDSHTDISHGPLRLAIIGQPNVGKSTLINRLLGEERMITGPEPGLTRDAISVKWKSQGHNIQLIDTAGLRRNSKVKERLERISAADTLSAIGMANVVVLMLDSTRPIERADLYAANLAIDEGRALILALNKWDLVNNPSLVLEDLSSRLHKSLPQVKGIPIISISALEGSNVSMLLPQAINAYNIWNTRIATSLLNRWISHLSEKQPPPIAQGRRNKIRYITQASVRPPTFILFIKNPKALPDSWVRFAINDLRKTFELPGVPVRFKIRKSRDTK